MLVPARGHGHISVVFEPALSGEVNADRDCAGFALGYMSLEGTAEQVEGCVTRTHGYSVPPLRLDMTAQVKPALLTLECGDDEGMRYRTAASDLLDEGRLVCERLRLCHATLTNNTSTPLVFRLLTAEPFAVVHMDPATATPTAQLLQTDVLTLRPRENALVTVGFALNPELLSHLDSDAECEGVELEVLDRERRLHFRQNLTVEFNNGSTQTLPLYASLVAPSMSLSSNELDFGTCLVGQRRELQIMLSNPTGSASIWKCVQESCSETCGVDTFQVSPDCGELEAHVTHVSRSKVLLQVFFTAKHAEVYKATYGVVGLLGELPCQLTLRGEGSYDGKHEALLNI